VDLPEKADGPGYTVTQKYCTYGTVNYKNTDTVKMKTTQPTW